MSVNNGKISLIIIFCLLLSLLFGTSVSADGITAQVTVDFGAGTVAVSGNLPSGSGRLISILVLKPGKTAIDGDAEYSDLTTAGANGDFRFEFKLREPKVESQDYTVIINSERENSQQFYFKYFGETVFGGIFAQIRTATAATLEQILNDNNFALELSLGVGSDYDALGASYKMVVLSTIAGNNYTSVYILRNNFNTAVAAQKAQEDIDTKRAVAMAAFKAAEASAEMLAALSIEAFEIELTTIYEQLGETAKERFLGVLIQKRAFLNTVFAVKDFFSEYVIIELVNDTDRSRLQEVFTQQNGVLKLSLSGKYENLYYLDRETVHKEIKKPIDNGVFYTTIEDIRTAFNKALAGIPDVTTPSGGGNGGGGGGGGSQSYASGQSIAPATILPIEIPSEKGFSDLSEAEWAVESIMSLKEKGIVNGTSEDTFSPNDRVTREQFLKMLILAFDLNDDAAACDFSDVSRDDWCYSYVASAFKLGIVLGQGNGEFGVNQEISRQDMAVMACRTAEYASLNFKIGEFNEFSDRAEISEYAVSAVDALSQAGIINGYDGKFDPLQTCTRAQAAKVVFELMKIKD